MFKYLSFDDQGVACVAGINVPDIVRKRVKEASGSLTFSFSKK